MTLAVPPARAVRHVAAHLPAAVKAGDSARITELLGQVKTTREVTDLVLLLARCADWGRLNAETGYIAAGTPRELHACYTRLRKGGVAHADIAPYIREGEGAYQREVRIARGVVKGTGVRAATLAAPVRPPPVAPVAEPEPGRTVTVALRAVQEESDAA